MALAAWISLNKEVFALQELIFQSVELFELKKAQKAICFRFVCQLAKNIALFLIERPVSSQHAFSTKLRVRIFVWSKMLNSGHIVIPPFTNANHLGSDFSVHG